jgi:small subunit ribosomal protein S1
MDTQEISMKQDQEAQPESSMASDAQAPQSADPQVAPESPKSNGKDTGSLEALKPGTQLKGTVRHIVEFGAFMDIGVGRDGLAHISTLKRAGVDKTLQVGDVLDVIVRRVDLDDNRISLTLPAADRSSKTPLKELVPDSIVAGQVVRLVDFGAFVDIGAQSDGLLHVSQLSGGFVSHPSEVLKIGDQVDVRILEVDAKRRRISLTMKQPDATPAPSRPSRPVPQQAEPDNSPRMPTAFEAAFEKARADRRGRRSR